MHQTVTNSRNIVSVFMSMASIVCFGVILIIMSSTLITLSPHIQGYTSKVSSSNVTFHSNDQGTVQIHSLAFSANSKPYNLTYGEWTARWWQWGYSIPKAVNR